MISVYARGMSQRDVARTVREIYGFSMSAETVSAITDRVWEDLEHWRSRPLEPVYAFVFVGCLYVPVRDGRGARNAAVYAVLAYDLRGRKDVPGLWMDDSEGAHRWIQVFDELRAGAWRTSSTPDPTARPGSGRAWGRSSRRRPTSAASSTWSATR